jgi:hypothetical protein
MNAVVTHNISDMERIARAFASSKLFGIQNADQALALCLIAQAEGRHPASAAQDYHIVSGRPAKKAEAMLRDFISAGGKVEWHALDDTQASATFSHPHGGAARIDWDMKRAQTAGLTTPMWKKYPRQMLRSRVVSEGVRTIYPMATSGMYVPEEVQDFAPSEPVTVTSEPQREPVAPAIEGKARKSSAQAKRDGDHEEIRRQLAECPTEIALDAWMEDFDTHTAELPWSWLDAIRDEVEKRRNEILEEIAAA